MNDYGMIEVSPDNGQTWINVIKDPSNYGWGWINQTTGQWNGNVADTVHFTGNSSGWYHFEIWMYSWDFHFGYNDSILFRFTFISDNFETTEEGWIIDKIEGGDLISSIEEFSTKRQITLHPNPTTGVITVSGTTGSVQVFDLLGREIASPPKADRNDGIVIDLSSYPSGVYIVKVGERTAKVILTK